MTLTDEAARQTAATQFDHNLVVAAGAGTGKTSLLVERLLNLLLTKTVSVKDVVVTTFTQKAAAELKERVGRSLVALGSGSPETESEAHRSKEWLMGSRGLDAQTITSRARTLSLDLSQAVISTLHSYASSLLRRHPMEAGMTPDFTPDTGEARRLLLEELWPRFLETELHSNGSRVEPWRNVLEQVPVSHLEEAAKRLVQTPQALAHLLHYGYRVFDPRVVFRQTAEDLLRNLESLFPETPDSLARKQMELQITVLRQFLERGLPGLEIDLGAHPALGSFWGKAYKKGLNKCPRRGEIEAAMEAATASLKDWHKLSPVNMEALADILKAFARTYEREAAIRGVPAMDDLLLTARDLLIQHPAIRDREAEQTRAFLVDEFQDTDPIQYEILFLLAATRGPKGKESVYDLPLKAGKLFIVGDPKQSIYRFRGADMEAYDRAVRAIANRGGELLDLTNNFRSVEPILHAVNTLFQAYMGETEDRSLEPEYHPLSCTREPSAIDPCVEFWSITDGHGLARYANRPAEACVVAEAIKDMVQSGTPPKDIALLFRATTRFSHYTRALAEAGLAFVEEGGKSFRDQPEVVEGLALLKTLANPADPVACVAAFRWTLGAVPDEELVAYAQAGGTFSWHPTQTTNRLLEQGSFPNIQRMVARLRELHETTRGMPVDRLVPTVLLQSELPLLQAAYEDGAQRLANLHKLSERAASIARERCLSWEQTLTVLEDNLSGEQQEWESPLADEAVNAVRVLTIHKAKGLEFPVVFLPDMRENKRGNTFERARYTLGAIEGDRCLGINFNYRNDVPSLLLQDRQKEHERAESKRLLYVAMTRAKDKLIVVASGANHAWKEGFAHWGYDPKNLRDGVMGGGVHHRIVPLPQEQSSAEGTLPPLVTEPVLRWEQRVQQLRETVLPEPFRSPSADTNASPPESRGGLPPEEARVLGDLMHRAMEQWEFEVPGNLEAHLASLLEVGSFPRRVVSEAHKLAVELETSDLAADLKTITVLGREVPLLLMDGDVVVSGYADLLYRDGDTLVVADYKTDIVTGSAPQAASMHEHQLTDYARAVQQAFHLSELPAREIIFLRSCVRVRL